MMVDSFPRQNELGKGWRRASPAENCWPLYESALSVEAEAAPTQPTGR